MAGALLILAYAVTARSPAPADFDRSGAIDLGVGESPRFGRPSAPPVAARPVVELEVAGFEFRSELRVRAGTTVRWTNRDPVPHTVTPDGEEMGWGSSLLDTGENFERTFETEGEYAYHCQPHPFMTARIIVTS